MASTNATDPASCRVAEDYLRLARHLKEDLVALIKALDSCGNREYGLQCQVLPDIHINETDMRGLTNTCKTLLENCRSKIEGHVAGHPPMRQCSARQPVDSGVLSTTSTGVQEQGEISLPLGNMTLDENTRVKSLGILPSDRTRVDIGTQTNAEHRRAVKSAPSAALAEEGEHGQVDSQPTTEEDKVLPSTKL